MYFALLSLLSVALSLVSGSPVPTEEVPTATTLSAEEWHRIHKNLSSVCVDMTPKHNDTNGKLFEPQTSEPPFTVDTDVETVQPGGSVKVTVQGEDGEKFLAIYIQARPVAGAEKDDDTAVGEFVGTSSVYPSSCTPGENNAASFFSQAPVSEVELTWKAPSDPVDVEFLVTVAVSYERFWIKVPSETVKVTGADSE